MLNKDNRSDLDFHKYIVGETCNQFRTRDQLLESARHTWKEIVPHGKVLLACDMTSCGPVEILAGPKKLMRLGNQVWKKWERSEHNDKLCIQLENQWGKLFDRAGLTNR